MLALCILAVQIWSVLGCYGLFGSYDYGSPVVDVKLNSSEDPNKYYNPIDIMVKYNETALGGTGISSELEKKWRNWMDEYNKELMQEDSKDELSSKEAALERGPDSGWPVDWANLPKGQMGANEPPPWAWAPVNYAASPEYCFLPIQRGTNTPTSDKSEDSCKPGVRFAYNTFLKDCSQFDYLGCGENLNNFMSENLCIEACMKTPVAGCEPDTMQVIDRMSDYNDIF